MVLTFIIRIVATTIFIFPFLLRRDVVVSEEKKFKFLDCHQIGRGCGGTLGACAKEAKKKELKEEEDIFFDRLRFLPIMSRCGWRLSLV